MSLGRVAAATVISTILAVGALTPALSTTAAPSTDRAAAEGCVSKPEYRKIKKGMTIAKVKRVTGTNGKKVSRHDLPGGGSVMGRAYKVCTSQRGGVGISFISKTGTYRLARKVVVWR